VKYKKNGKVYKKKIYTDSGESIRDDISLKSGYSALSGDSALSGASTLSKAYKKTIKKKMWKAETLDKDDDSDFELPKKKRKTRA
jgi:hypothetical protein